MAEQPEWRWNGPDIPAVKAAFNDLVPDANGDRVWVAREGPGRQIPGCDLDQALEAGKMICWRSEVFWDVFAHDGTYLGEVAAPDGAFLRTSHIDGNRVITTVIDDEGLVRVLRLRLQAPDAS